MRPSLAAASAACLLALGAAALAAPGGARSAVPSRSTVVVRPVAALKTPSLGHHQDADDPAIWIHPVDPARSLIIGTNKHQGLLVYDADGRLLQAVSNGTHPDNVDVLYDFGLAGGHADLAVAACRAHDSLGVKFWLIDPVADTLRDVTEGSVIPVLGGTEPYGSTVYHSTRTGKCYFFVTSKAGAVEQYAMEDAGDGKVGATRVRAFSVGSIAEGCVADDELGYLYVSQERVGIWKIPAEPESNEPRRLITRVPANDLRPDVEGLTLYCASNGRGYLIASSQGNDSFKIYEREGDNHFLLTIKPQASGGIAAPLHTDGIAVTNCPTSTRFAKGLFVAHDGGGDGKGGDFHFYAWEAIAGDRLIVDTRWSPRAEATRQSVGLHLRHGGPRVRRRGRPPEAPSLRPL